YVDIFLFSSRRRHTRFSRDWSSDVCSSDLAYRRQRVDEDGALRDATRLHTERFTTAVSQLGDPSPAVKLGGVHALAGLADDAPRSEERRVGKEWRPRWCAYQRREHESLYAP